VQQESILNILAKERTGKERRIENRRSKAHKTGFFEKRTNLIEIF